MAAAASPGASASHPLAPGRFGQPVDPHAVAADWAARGFSCRLFVDPPGQEWKDFVHPVNELVTVLEGRLQLTVGGRSVVLAPGDECFIPRQARHSVKNLHPGATRWLFGYDG